MTADRYELARTIIELVESELAAAGFELLDVRIFRGGGRLQLRIYVDIPGGGIDLDGCARASRTADMLLEESGLIAERYVIEVSSPGVRRPLRTPGHFAGRIGENAELRVVGDEPGRMRRVRIVAADDAGVTVERLGEVAVPPAGDDEAGAEEVDASAAGRDAEATDHGAGVETISYARILEANLDPEFDAAALIREDRRQRKEEKRRARAERSASKGRRRPRK